MRHTHTRAHTSVVQSGVCVIWSYWLKGRKNMLLLPLLLWCFCEKHFSCVFLTALQLKWVATPTWSAAFDAHLSIADAWQHYCCILFGMRLITSLQRASLCVQVCGKCVCLDGMWLVRVCVRMCACVCACVCGNYARRLHILQLRPSVAKQARSH